MKKIYGTLAMIVVIAFHFAARFVMEDEYTFTAAAFNQIQTETQLSSNPSASTQFVNNEIMAGAPVVARSNFNFIISDPFANQWNP